MLSGTVEFHLVTVALVSLLRIKIDLTKQSSFVNISLLTAASCSNSYLISASIALLIIHHVAAFNSQDRVFFQQQVVP